MADAHPIGTVVLLAILFGSIFWLLAIRSADVAPLVGLSLGSTLWGICMFLLLRWTHRNQTGPSDDGETPVRKST
jgi:drug/metabolite transporter (DMT)-like permease